MKKLGMGKKAAGVTHRPVQTLPAAPTVACCISITAAVTIGQSSAATATAVARRISIRATIPVGNARPTSSPTVASWIGIAAAVIVCDPGIAATAAIAGWVRISASVAICDTGPSATAAATTRARGVRIRTTIGIGCAGRDNHTSRQCGACKA
jgi:hypothetical protein